VDQILQSLPVYMMIGIVVVIGVSQFNRLAGAILGVVFWLSVAIVGTQAYEQGGGIGLPGFKFPKELFYAICALFTLLSAFTGFVAFKKRQQVPRGGRPSADDDDE
jgi:hypothetical protein